MCKIPTGFFISCVYFFKVLMYNFRINILSLINFPTHGIAKYHVLLMRMQFPWLFLHKLNFLLNFIILFFFFQGVRYWQGL